MVRTTELTGHTSRVLFMLRPQMDALWPLQPRMRQFKLGMCLGFREFQNPYEKKVCCHLLIHTPFVEDHVNAGEKFV
ncbi:unnamed protein product [Prunus armeniaca]|uniref:Uncharacterized protein n=1 Tax=Prunus armeniaca TaxID=36596 RepID=A0A6J5XU55_PRUAR|nr:unnamed protein product [Prunus armeniaca]